MIHKIFMTLSFIWLASEIILGRLTYHKPAESADRDRRTLQMLWLVIIGSICLGVWLGLSGVGHLPALLPAAPYLATILVSAGLLLRWTAFISLHRYFTSNVTILEEHQLIQHGVYGIIRHPAYAGSLLSFLGLGIYFCSWVSLLVIFLPILAVFLKRIQTEEAALREAFGKGYEDYSRRTRRLLPGVY
ncbi:MAG: isoprenylcysteine carboxylmethyltransferase family protein [Calditrichia bacterium]